MRRKSVVVRECYNVVAVLVIEFERLLGGVLAFVQRTIYAGVGVKVGTLPAVCGVEVAIWVEDIFTAKWCRLLELVDDSYTGGDSRKQYDK